MAEAQSQYYKQGIPCSGVSLERGTSRVPNDGRFYLLVNDEVREQFRTLGQAQVAYRALLKEIGYQPPSSSEGIRVDPARDAVERYADSLEEYWDEGHKFRRHGGKTMYRR